MATLNLAACADLLDLPLKRLQEAIRSHQFPDPVEHEDGQPRWTHRLMAGRSRQPLRSLAGSHFGGGLMRASQRVSSGHGTLVMVTSRSDGRYPD